MSAQRFTVEEIEAAAMLHKKYVNDAKAFGATVTLVTEHAHAAAMLRAFALQTRQVEHMREVCELIASIYHHGNFKAETHNERTLEALLRQLGHWPYTPKDGGQ